MSTKSLLLASVAYIVAGAAAGGLLANGSAMSSAPEKLQESVVKVAMPMSNTATKQDRLAVTASLAAPEPATTGSLAPVDEAAPVSRQGPSQVLAYAAEPPARAEKVGPPVPWVGQPQPAAPAKPKQSAKRSSNFAILSDEQIASVKERMKLTPYQAQHWPAIEAALRKIALKLNRNKSVGEATAAALDPNGPEVEELKSAAMPVLFTLTEDQKREVRTLARVIGLESVASAI